RRAAAARRARDDGLRRRIDRAVRIGRARALSDGGEGLVIPTAPDAWYADRRVLVIGGLGFIGGRLTAHLRRAGARVTVVTRSFAAYRDAIADHDAHGVRFVEADLRDGPAMAAAIA